MIFEAIERVKTYQILKWSYRSPVVFNPYKLASMGYECIGLNALECHICHHHVELTTPEFEEKQENAVLSELSNHDDSCLYKNEEPIDLSESQLYLRMDDLIEKTKKSYGTPNSIALPILDLSRFWEEVGSHGQQQIFDVILEKFKIKPLQMRISFALTVLGWTYLPQSQQLECAFCGRVDSISSYKTTTEKFQLRNERSSSDENYENQKPLFDPFTSHRYFCCWVNQTEGWSIYVQHLWDKLGESEQLFKKENPEELKKIRVHMDKYLQTFSIQTSEQFQKISKILSDCEQMAEVIENSEEDKQAIRRHYVERRASLKDFVSSIENEIKNPLKKMKFH